MNPEISREDEAEALREQAASFRRLARTARTPTGSVALNAIAEEFDTDARRTDPRSLRR